jgi:DNA-binding MarR family transcriptional regulator
VTVLPLTSDEELVWRNLMRLVFQLPRAIDEDLQRTCGLSSTQYSVLMHLSESPDRQLRMSDLAGRCGLSPSHITRVIDQMTGQGLVERRRPESSDGRSTLAVLTKQGMSTLRSAWPHHIRSVRALAFDHLTADETRTFGHLLERLAEHLDTPRWSTPTEPGHRTR